MFALITANFDVDLLSSDTVVFKEVGTLFEYDFPEC